MYTEHGPEQDFDPNGGTIFYRPMPTPKPPTQMPPEHREGNYGGPERYG